MLDRLFRKKKSRVFLGTIAVAPRTDLKRFLDEPDIFAGTSLDQGVRKSLEDLFALPPAADVEQPGDTDLGVDIMVTRFQLGEALFIGLGRFGLPIFWRPKVMVSSRLFYLRSGKTKAAFSVAEKVKWRHFLKRALNPAIIFGIRSMYDEQDLDHLLQNACHKLLLKMNKRV